MWKHALAKGAIADLDNPTDVQIQSAVDNLIDFYADGS